jgi:hypothetical protein
MLTTIRKILEAKETSVQDTIYCNAADSILDFPITIGDFFKLTKYGTGASDFEVLNNLYVLAEGKKKNSEYQAVCSKIQQITVRLNEMKNIKNSTDELTAEKLELRISKKNLNKKKIAMEEKFLAHSIEEIEKKRNFGLKFLAYKDFLNCSNFSEIEAMLPQVAAVDTPKLREMPLFVRGIGDLVQAVKSGASLGIVGGPCLFGTHEVIIKIHQADGEIVQFDFSTGRAYDKNNLLSAAKFDIESYFSTRYQNIIRLEFTNFKHGVTYQEYLSMQYLFEFARVLGAKVVIPIPDISYVKFFKGVTKLIDDEVKESAFKVFERISYDISDMYLKVIVDLQFRYSEVECQVLHSRNTDLCKLFYAKRQQYIQKLSRQGRITLYDGKLDAVIDYITMLALPYYVYGTKNVLQIDSVDEADSMRKCMKVHSSDVTFHSILFPEYLCEDGVHTIFNAPLEFKDYISTGG